MPRRVVIALAAALALAAAEARAIEMFTFFGDGSQIGLPRLEVPVEAYRGIPLRSDRIRARRRVQRAGQAGVGRATAPETITLRAMPAPETVGPRTAIPVAPEPR